MKLIFSKIWKMMTMTTIKTIRITDYHFCPCNRLYFFLFDRQFCHDYFYDNFQWSILCSHWKNVTSYIYNVYVHMLHIFNLNNQWPFLERLEPSSLNPSCLKLKTRTVITIFSWLSLRQDTVTLEDFVVSPPSSFRSLFFSNQKLVIIVGCT